MIDYKFKIKDLTFLKHFCSSDHMGSFEKIVPINNLDFTTKEVFFSKSKKGVIRGMHIQKDPYPTSKLIKVINGKIMDVILDCREDSKTFGRFDFIELNSESNVLYIPVGCAHGFQTLSDNATMLYLTDNVYNPNTDIGYHFDSFGFNWPLKNKSVSERDLKLPNFI